MPAPPLPTLDYIDGMLELPAELFVFVAVISNLHCEPARNCPAVEAIREPYDYTAGELIIDDSVLLEENRYRE